MSEGEYRSYRHGRAKGDMSGFERGTNQAGGRLYNERLVLSLVRRNGALPKAEIARLTGLSPQTITTIANGLERDGLLERQAPRRGKVGQPSVPYALAPDGALAFGLKVGRRSADMVVMDLAGNVRGQVRQTYPYPNPEHILDFMRENIKAITQSLTAVQRDRIAGLGIATPFELWNWEQEIGAPRETLQAWKDTDLKREAAKEIPWPVYLYNDATAACAAELLLANPAYQDFLYVFVGSFIGGGVVLNGSLFPGRSGYAGAIAPLPIKTKTGTYEQVLHSTSLYELEQRIAASGMDAGIVWREDGDWRAIGPILDDWIENLCENLAVITLSATAIIDFEAVVIDGGFPADIRTRIVETVRRKLDDFDRQGLSPVAVVPGQLGGAARAMGGACLPLLSNFTLDRDVLFIDTN